MASSLISSSLHVDFDSVFGMDDAGLVQMFESFIVTGLKDFLGCPAVFYEAVLTEFFENSSVRDGVVVSTIRGTAIEISEEMFTAVFDLPMEGSTDLSEVLRIWCWMSVASFLTPRRNIFSDSKKKVSISYLKKEMKLQYRLLSDILVKTLYVKAGSFDAVTRDRFMLMTAITCDVKINWSNLLFGILKDMMTPGSRQAKGFAIQICVILKNVPGLELGESRAFPASSVLTAKTVHRYVVINEKIGAEDVTYVPRVKKAPKTKATPKKRTVVASVDEPIVREKRMLILGDDDDIFKDQSAEIVDSETIVGGNTAEQPAAEVELASVEDQPAADAATGVHETEVETADDSIHDETVVESIVEPAVVATTDDADTMIEQVLDQLALITATQDDDEAVEGDQDVGPYDVGEHTADKADESEKWFNLAYEKIYVHEGDQPHGSEIVAEEITTNDELLSIEEHLAQIPSNASLPSAPAPNITQITFGQGIEFRETFLSEHIDESQSGILSKLHTIERSLRDSLLQQDEAFRTLFQGARQEGRTIDDVQTLRFNEFRKIVLANSASVTIDFLDVKKAVRELNAKVDAVATGLVDVRKDLEATKESISHQLLEFQAQAQANHNILSDKLRELVNYINRGGNDKKGEGSSRGPQPPPDDQNRGSGNTGGGGDNVRTTSIVDRLIDADRRRERGSEGSSRGNRSGTYKRRR
ncbi:hypothetical protein F511_26353 [Dorcoceras hygrometricum]|uniref:Dystroglycan-like n=1 Tax=Dorcoceras hygrometricum TaxID=472368 RepID=A0A2Z7CQ77_9LAMI|nr:hypothetical protein F511_26353 [Dorcoceras hygrometricum]